MFDLQHISKNTKSIIHYLMQYLLLNNTTQVGNLLINKNKEVRLDYNHNTNNTFNEHSKN